MLDITTLAAWGEFIGGIAVVVSLLYLASQIRQNSKLLQVSTTAAVLDSDRSTISEILREPKLARLWTLGTDEFSALPESEQLPLGSMLGLQIAIFYRNYYFAMDGTIRDSVWEAEKRQISALLQRAWVQQNWNQTRTNYSDEFGEFVDGLIRECDATT